MLILLKDLGYVQPPYTLSLRSKKMSIDQRLEKIEKGQQALMTVLSTVLMEGRERRERLERLEQNQQEIVGIITESQKAILEGQQKIVGLIVEMQNSEHTSRLDHEQRISRLEEQR